MLKRRLSLVIVIAMILTMLVPSVYAVETNVNSLPISSVIAEENRRVSSNLNSDLLTDVDVISGSAIYGYLSDLSREPRKAGTDKEVQAKNYIVKVFENMGYDITLQAFTYSSYNSNNIIAVKKGNSVKQIIVGAHYDSVTAGKGADDNASGVAVMLGVAEQLKNINTEYTIKFIAFGAEEVGKKGSSYYASQMSKEEKSNTIAMINLDSVLAGDKMYVYGDAGEKGWLREQSLSIAKSLNLNLETQNGLNPEYPAGTTGDWSDHAPFQALGIPYAYFESTNWGIGHKDGYTQTVEYGAIFHSPNDSITFLNEKYPGRVEERLKTFTLVLYNLLVTANPNSNEETTPEINIPKSGDWYTYDELKPAVDIIINNAKNNRYIRFESLGKSAEGRDIPFVIFAKSSQDVDNYLNITLPKMMEDPASIISDINAGNVSNYKPAIWFNNTHANEANGVDAQIDILKRLATEDKIKFKTNLNNENSSKENTSKETEVTLNVNELLDNYIILFSLCINPDGRVDYFQRETAAGFDPNRDVTYQTQVEDANVFQALSKWSPMIMNDFHGFVNPMLIEPCTPPHDPNFEFDLLMNTMVEHAHSIGQAAICNTKYNEYQIPRFDMESGWDDGGPMYAAVLAMMHGAMGHTIEVPSLNQESNNAFVYGGMGSLYHALQNKEKLYKNQLEIYRRGVEGIDSHEVDKFLINAKGELIGRPRKGNDNFFPEYYVLPINKELQKNSLAAHDMINYFLKNHVKVEKTTSDVTIDGKTYPTGSYVIPMHQAKRGFVNTILYEGSDFSDWGAMYAEVVMSFPDLRGFNRYEVRVSNLFEGKTEKVTEIKISSTVVPQSDKVIIRNTNNDVIKAVNELLANNKTVKMIYSSGEDFKKGDFVVQKNDIESIENKYYLELVEYNENAELRTINQPKVKACGVELTYVLKQLGFSLADKYEESNIIVDENGVAGYSEVKGIIKKGKPYVGIGGSALSEFSYNYLLSGFKVRTSSHYEGLLRANVNADNVITGGYNENDILYTKSGSYIESVPSTSTVLAKLSDADNFYVAGWWPGHDKAKGKAYIIQDKVGDAKITLFANHIVNRAHPSHQFRMLANAIYDGVVSNDVEKPKNIITASTGGTYSTKGAIIKVPAEAFSEDFTISVNKLNNTSKLPLEKNEKLLSDVYEITKDKEGKFTKAVTITLKYDKKLFDEDKYKTGIYYLDEVNNKWVVLDNIAVNNETSSISGNVTHFTKFAVIGTKKYEEKPENMIIASQGGKISADGADVIVPAGALDKDFTVSIQKINGKSDLPLGKNEKLLSEAYEITKDKEGNFTKAVTITLKYDKKLFDESKYVTSIYYLDETSNKWVVLDNAVVNKEASSVSGNVTHFTKFAVIGSEKSNNDNKNNKNNNNTVDNSVKAGKSGNVSKDGVEITIPANATDKDIKIVIKALTKTSNLPIKSNEKLVSEVYEITKDKSGNFSKPITISLKYNKNSVDSSKYTLSLYWFDETDNKWVELDDVVVDQKSGLVKGTVNHFTKFAVLAKAIETEEQVTVPTDAVGHWAEKNIKEMIKLGAIAGYPDNTFKPDNNITRAEFATILVKAFKLEAKSEKIFADTQNSWAKSYMSTAAENGIISGYGNNLAGPDDLITREQMAVMIAKAAKLASSSDDMTFMDKNLVSSWAKEYVASAVKAKKLSGYPDGSFRPKNNATRAEAITVIMNCLNNSGR